VCDSLAARTYSERCDVVDDEARRHMSDVSLTDNENNSIACTQCCCCRWLIAGVQMTK